MRGRRSESPSLEQIFTNKWPKEEKYEENSPAVSFSGVSLRFTTFHGDFLHDNDEKGSEPVKNRQKSV